MGEGEVWVMGVQEISEETKDIIKTQGDNEAFELTESTKKSQCETC